MTLNEEGRGAQSVERTLPIVLDADVQLVVTYGHQGVLELVHTVANLGEGYILKSPGSHLNESDTEDIVHVVLKVPEHVTHKYSVALLDSNDSVFIVDRVGKGRCRGIADVG